MDIKAMRDKCQSPRRDCDTWYGRNFARKISIYITALFVKLNINAMAATTIFLLSGIIITSKGLVIYFLLCVFTGLLSYYILMYLLRKDIREKIIKKLFRLDLEDDNNGDTE